MKGSLSESYNNGRHALTGYYISNIFKWHGFFTTGIGIIVITFFPALLGLIFDTNDIELYRLAIPFIIPNIIHTVTCEGLDGTAGQILNMCNYQWFASLVAIGHNITSLITTYLWLYVFMLPQTYRQTFCSPNRSTPPLHLHPKPNHQGSYKHLPKRLRLQDNPTRR